MTIIFNKSKQKHRRRALRSNSTNAEELLWDRLRNRRLDGLKFRRQYGVNRFIVDFYCPANKLAVEVDGGYHNLRYVVQYDSYRQKMIESLGIRFLRFKNEEVIKNMGKVLKKIIEFTNYEQE